VWHVPGAISSAVVIAIATIGAVMIGAVPGVIVGGKLYLALRRPVERVPRASVR